MTDAHKAIITKKKGQSLVKIMFYTLNTLFSAASAHFFFFALFTVDDKNGQTECIQFQHSQDDNNGKLQLVPFLCAVISFQRHHNCCI